MSSASFSDLQRKYAEERNKRLRPDGLKQFLDLTGTDLAEDPFVDSDARETQQAPIQDGGDVKFLIVGAGHSGILFAVRLIQAGFRPEQVCIVDAAGGFGGTWYWNRYPGLMCDVEGYVYLPLLEESGFVPRDRYSYGYEIRANAEHIAAKWGFNNRCLFSTWVNHQRWDDEKGRWTVKLTQNRGRGQDALALTINAQFLFNAAGILPTPHIPKLPGLDDFRRSKHLFHTARWNYKVTGGTQENPELTGLKGKRVGLIGTGATAVQIVPELARWADTLHVFQRTPSYCGPRNQRPTDYEEWKTQIASKPGWQLERQENFNHFITADPVDVDLVSDGWTDTQAFAGVAGNPRAAELTPDHVEEHIAAMFRLDVSRAERIRAHIGRVVEDPAVAEKLKPWYPGWCKRPTFHDHYLQAFNRSNVTLVDTDGKGVERYTKNGVVANGIEYDLDVLVFATGFSNPKGPAPCPTVGRGGALLSEKWSSGGWGNVFGLTTNGFPNLFFSSISGGAPVSSNLTSTFDMVAKLAVHIVAEASHRAEDTQRLTIEATKEAEEAFGRELRKRAVWYSLTETCPPSYFNHEGEVFGLDPAKTAQAAAKTSWGSGPIDFWRMAQEYMAKGTLDEFEIKG